MSNYNEEPNPNEIKQSDRFFLIIFGILLICLIFVNDTLPTKSNFIKIEGTLAKNVRISTGGKSSYNFFEFKLKEDIYKKAIFSSSTISFDIDRKLIRNSLKKDSIVSFHISKSEFESSLSIQNNDINGSKKLNECTLDPITMFVNGKEIFSFEDYIKSRKNEKWYAIILGVLGVILLLCGIFYKRFIKFYKRREGLIWFVAFLICIIFFIYIRYFQHMQYL